MKNIHEFSWTISDFMMEQLVHHFIRTWVGLLMLTLIVRLIGFPEPTSGSLVAVMAYLACLMSTFVLWPLAKLLALGSVVQGRVLAYGAHGARTRE